MNMHEKKIKVKEEGNKRIYRMVAIVPRELFERVKACNISVPKASRHILQEELERLERGEEPRFPKVKGEGTNMFRVGFEEGYKAAMEELKKKGEIE